MLNDFFSALPFVLSLFWAVTLALDFVRGEKKYDRLYLLLFFVACTLLYFGHAVHFGGGDEAYTFADSIYAGANLAVYPLFYLYLRQLTTPQKLPWYAAGLALIPAIAVFFISIAEASARGCLTLTPVINKIVFPVTVLFCCIGSFTRLNLHNRIIENLYSNTEGKTLRRLYLLLALMVIASAMSIVLNSMGRDYFDGNIHIAIPSAFFTAILYAIAYTGSRNSFAAQDAALDFPEEIKGADDEENANLIALSAKLDAIMADRELYTRPNLKISELAETAGTNRTYVSNAINGIKGISFSDYVNSFRIKRAKELMLSRENSFTMSVVAEKSGFLSEATFYRQFKAVTGLTPNQWLHTVRG